MDVSLSSSWVRFLLLGVRSFPSRVRSLLFGVRSFLSQVRFLLLGVRSFPSQVRFLAPKVRFLLLEVRPRSPFVPLSKRRFALQAHIRDTLLDRQTRASAALNRSQSVKPHPAVSRGLNEGSQTLLNSTPLVNPPRWSLVPLLVFYDLSYARLSYDPIIPHTSH